MNAFFLIATTPKRLASITIWLRLLLLAPLWANLPTSFATPIVYNVAVDTSVVQGSDGFVDFQFNVNGLSSLNVSSLTPRSIARRKPMVAARGFSPGS